ncbi:ankyrin repeat domain-containing protein [Armatimonas sp.]|uniref:ankyrin repeat domain-containing protein n=1 Tax=Armatimonas sp. TaxID=1872638 RepID=UPI00374CEB2D
MFADEPPLHRAARLGDIAALERLVADGADINARIDVEWEYLSECWNVTPLMVSARSVDGADVATLAWLLDQGADLFATSDERGRQNAAWYAAGLGGRCDCMPWRNVPNHGERLRFLLDAGLEPTNYILWEACDAGDPARVRLLLECGMSPHPTDEGYSFAIPLLRAAKSGSAECVQLLLDVGADPNIMDCQGMTTILGGAGSAEVVQVLLATGANRDQAIEYNGDALGCLLECAFEHDACHLGPRSAAQALLDAGAPLELASGSRLPALAQRRDADALDWLIDHGASVPKTGWTALHAVCWGGEHSIDGEVRAEIEQIIRRLVASGIPINARTVSSDSARCPAGATPLHEAVWGDAANPTAVRTLLELGAEVDAVDEVGRTPLHCALPYATECIPLLLAAGADPLRPDHAGITPLALAEQSVSYYQDYLDRDEVYFGRSESPTTRRLRYLEWFEAAQKTVALLAGAGCPG